jgi:uncharacterized protein (TIGR01777 family)
MRVLVSGSTGLVGTALTKHLLQAGHEPVRLVRSTRPDDDLPSVTWDPAAGLLPADTFDAIDAVVHLAGEGIAERRWSDEQKARILDSRVAGTTLLADGITAADDPPAVLLSGSAIGFYGDRGNEVITEKSEPGTGYLADVVTAWEGATSTIPDPPTRVAHLRTGIVLSSVNGALAQQLPFFKLGAGGRIGDGRQWWSWISIDDMVSALVWLLDNEVHGPVNLTAPGAVTNAEFTRVLGRVLHRPTLIPTPKPALWARLGRELTEALLYSSQRISPTVLEDRGFEFRHPDLESALRTVLDRPN